MELGGGWLTHKESHFPAFLSLDTERVCKLPSIIHTSIAVSYHFYTQPPFRNIMAQNIHTQSVAFGNNNANCGNTIGSYNTTIYSSDEDAKIMHWLSPLEPDKRHHSLRTDRFEGVGNWLLETSEFREWRGGEGGVDQPVLFCSGDPGVGKTHLRSAARFL